MSMIVDAHYREVELPEYRGHPLISALPPIAPDDVVYPHFSTEWSSSEQERAAPAHIRKKMLKRIKQFLYSLPEYIDIFRSIEDAIITGYLPKNPSTPTGQHFLHYIERDATSTQPVTGIFCPTGTALSLFGESGAGKTRGVERSLDWYPQVISHDSFLGRPLNLRQVVWLRVDCPPSASIWGFVTEIIDQLDKALGTNELERGVAKPRNIHEAGVFIQRKLRSLWVGILVLDELQNLEVGASDLRKQFLNLLLHIINSAGVPILFCGNQESKALLQTTLRNARRAEDGGSTELGAIDPVIWPDFVKKLWQIQYTSVHTPLDDDLSARLFLLSKGLPAFAVNIYSAAQALVIGSHEEVISCETLDEGYLAACSLSANALENVPLPSTENDTKESPAPKAGADDPDVAPPLSPTTEQNPAPIADIDRVQHSEFSSQTLNTRRNNFRVPLGVDTDILRSAGNATDPYLYLIENKQVVVDLFAGDSLMRRG